MSEIQEYTRMAKEASAPKAPMSNKVLYGALAAQVPAHALATMGIGARRRGDMEESHKNSAGANGISAASTGVGALWARSQNSKGMSGKGLTMAKVLGGVSALNAGAAGYHLYKNRQLAEQKKKRKKASAGRGSKLSRTIMLAGLAPQVPGVIYSAKSDMHDRKGEYNEANRAAAIGAGLSAAGGYTSAYGMRKSKLPILAGKGFNLGKALFGLSTLSAGQAAYFANEYKKGKKKK